MKRDYAGKFKELVESVGYELIDEYTGAKVKVKIKCPEGHEYNIRPSLFKQGYRCPKCSNLCPIQAKEQFLELLEKENYELLSEYKNTISKVKLKCNKGHIYETMPSDFKNHDTRCPVCSNKCPIQAKIQFIELLNKEDYELLSEYKGAITKVKLKCPKGHEWKVKPSHFKYSYIRCPHCKGSTGQRLLQKMLLEYDIGDVIYNDRKILNGLELDIYYPELKIAIEYQGNYWHSRSEVVEKDKRKKLLCEEMGIKLIEVWDNDFLKNHDKITKEVYNKITGVMNRQNEKT